MYTSAAGQIGGGHLIKPVRRVFRLLGTCVSPNQHNFNANEHIQSMTMTKKLHSCRNVIICQHLLPLIEFVFVLRRRDSAMVKPSQTSTKCQFIVPSSSFDCRHHQHRNSFYPYFLRNCHHHCRNSFS